MDDLPSTYDKFSLPGEIPDGYGVPSEDWQARGLAHPAGRGWHPDRPPSDAEIDARLAQWGVRLRPSPGRGSQAGRWAGDPPAPPAPAEDELLAGGAAPGPGQVFTPALQVRFLDSLATSGNVRVSAARVGVSHETAYRQRRRCARFAALWQAALHHARHRVEAVIGDRALDGTIEEVWFRGELVGHKRRYDGRLLLAHIARLDRLAEEGHVAAHAEWFDAGLARLAGHPEPDGFDEAQGLWDEDAAGYGDGDGEGEGAGEAASPPPPTRREWTAWFRGQALDGVKRKDEDRVWDEAGAEAEALYDEWEAGARALVDAILAGEAADRACEAAPVEYKSRKPVPARGAPLDTVTGVNTPGLSGHVGDHPQEQHREPDHAGQHDEARALAQGVADLERGEGALAVFPVELGALGRLAAGPVAQVVVDPAAHDEVAGIVELDERAVERRARAGDEGRPLALGRNCRSHCKALLPTRFMTAHGERIRVQT